MTDREDLKERLDGLEGQFGVGPTHLVAAIGDGGEWPDGVGREDIIHRTEEPGIHTDEPIVHESLVVPHHRPPEFRGGIVIMSPAEIAQVYDRMPDDVREKELELRIENGDPIPPILQQ